MDQPFQTNPAFFSKEVDCLTDYLLGKKAESGGHGRSFMRVALDVDFFVFSLFISPGGAGALVATDLLVPGTSLCQLLRVLKQWPMKGSKVPSHSFLFSWWRGRAGGDGPSCAWKLQLELRHFFFVLVARARWWRRTFLCLGILAGRFFAFQWTNHFKQTPAFLQGG